jgi:hypothetical protein
MPDQGLEELPLDWREMHLLGGCAPFDKLRTHVPFVDHMIIEIDGPPSELDGFEQLGLSRTPSDGPNSREKLLNTERLGDIVIGTGIKRIDFGRAVHPAGEDHDGHLGPLSKRADDINAIDVRQAEIKDDEVWMSVGCRLEGAPTGAGGHDVVLPRVQVDS